MELQTCTVNKNPEEEFNLAKLLKNEYCDDTGKETHPKYAAEIFHKLGKIYRRQSPNKLSLIKSVGLFNAAIVRNPSNLYEVKHDLSEICQHILKMADAKVQNADLLKKAHEVKQLFNELRNEVDELLDNLEIQKIPTNNLPARKKTKLANNKISSVQQINQLIACKYKQIMAGVGQFCEDGMGKPPCKYAIAGMGSLARSEITPYSDFEHIILLTDDKNYRSYVDYFRWYSVIFHTIILNVQETDIYNLDIDNLNNKTLKLGNWYFDAYTPKGISFDGLMPHQSKFPLGRKPTKNKPFETELIKPVSEMLEYLSSEADLKNGYPLSDILTKTCFVFGNEDVFKQFENSVENKLKQTPKPKRIEEVRHQVKDDLDNYSSRFRLAKLKSNNIIDIKQLIYRSSTIFIAALGRIHNILANSSFEIVNEMQKIGEVTKTTQDKLNYAIAIACEIRLKTYSKNKCQNDSPIDLIQDDETVKQFFDLVGEANTIKYFQIAYCLQCEVAKQLKFTKLHFYSDPQLFNFTLGLTFNIKSLKSIFLKYLPKFVWDRNEFNFDRCIERLETSVGVEHESTLSDSASHSNITLIGKLVNHLHSIKAHDDALEFYEAMLEIYKDKTTDEWKDDFVALIHNNAGNCLMEMQHYEEALTYLQKSLKIKQNISLDEEKDGDIAMTVNNIGLCLKEMQRYDDALNHLKQSLKIDRKLSLDDEKDGTIAITLNNIGICLRILQRYNEALTYFKPSLQIHQSISLDEQKDGNIAMTLINFGNCLRKMQRYDDALVYLKQSHEIHRNISFDERKDSNIARTLNSVGLCLMDMQRNDDALIQFKQALEIYRNITLDDREDGNIAMTLNNIGLCLMELQLCDDALIHLKQTLEIDRNLSLDEQNDGNIANTLDNIGKCLMEMRSYDDALNNLKQSLKIYRSISNDQQKDENIAKTLNNFGRCLTEMQRYDDALVHLTQSLEIYRDISLDKRKDGNIADTLHNIGKYLMKMQRYDDAVIHLQQLLEIRRNLSLDKRKDCNISMTLRNLGYCLMQMQHYDDAVNHLKQSLEIDRNISLDEQKDSIIANTQKNIEKCLMEIQHYDDVVIH